MHAQPDCALQIENLSLGYGGKIAVENASGRVVAGQMLAVVGPNGAGKSTLLKALAGLHRPVSGRIVRPTGSERPSYMPQHSDIDRTFPISVRDFVAMGLWKEIGAWRRITRAHRVRIAEALAQVGLCEAESKQISALSGGQFRRMLFARLYLQEAPLVLLDEPFAGVDAATTTRLLDIIHGWQREGRSVIAALHDLAQVRAHFATTLLLARRVVAWGSTEAMLTDQALALAQELNTQQENAPV